MSRIKEKFAELEAKDQKALVSYVMAGFPSERATIATVRGLVRGGTDIIEIGFPFSDPLADGPVIQNASTISLANGTKTDRLFGLVRKIRKETDIPILLMTYTNILYRRGYSKFITEATDTGIDGFILPDMSVEESEEYLHVARGRTDTVFLASLNTSKARMRRILGASTGFLYLVAVYGTTGTEMGIKRYTLEAIRSIKSQVGGRIPVGVGFGVSTPTDVKRYVRAGADAVIVGSAYLRLVEKTPLEKIESRIASFAEVLKRQTVL